MGFERNRLKKMNKDPLCYCGTNQPYSSCCEPFLKGEAYPNTALALMRSRYTAYATSQINYIADTMTGKAAIGFDAKDTLDWSKTVRFTHLAILGSTDNTVEFKAFYKHQGKASFIHENSLFKRIKGKWFYVDKIPPPKPQRNQPCPCGSDKKYKHCCGQS